MPGCDEAAALAAPVSVPGRGDVHTVVGIERVRSRRRLTRDQVPGQADQRLPQHQRRVLPVHRESALVGLLLVLRRGGEVVQVVARVADHVDVLDPDRCDHRLDGVADHLPHADGRLPGNGGQDAVADPHDAERNRLGNAALLVEHA